MNTDWNTPEISSRINNVFMTPGQRLAALRFILALPEFQMIHIKTMPPIVFEYIYIVGHLEDVPWLMFIEDDLGTSIARTRRSMRKVDLWELIKRSPLFRAMNLKLAAGEWYVGRLTLEDLEVTLFRYAQSQALKNKNLFLT